MAKNTLRGLLFGIPILFGSLYMTQVDQSINASTMKNNFKKFGEIKINIEEHDKQLNEKKVSYNTLDDFLDFTESQNSISFNNNDNDINNNIKNKTYDKESNIFLFKPEGHFYVDTEAYDSIIIEKTNYWNNYFNLSGKDKLDPNLIKAMILQESSGNSMAYKTDPMQIANQGDYALDVLALGDELTYRYTTEEFRKHLESIGHTPKGKYGFIYSKSKMDPETSIEAGILWLIHKGNIHDVTGKVISHRDWNKALDRYNGGGIQNYSNKVLEYLEN